MLKRLILISAAAAALGACATAEPDVTPEQAARAECERRQTPPDQMTACIEEAEDTIRAARDQQ
ncbi:MAG: hypothetical protein K2X34_09260, partial [Hyphomonadaceae bacterium]|nr:hypothetical protein [Hyphomonadaceae bacterium]